ncbi:small rab-related gtpase [Anaeramoeba flamelloides]|uniref:Small rab-related gtpase n=1 Tax=Anaeramoeba flamelloides TaxID=1746091 RepID=A0ABQ8Y761_9EUKA|nr:small rab-related gtpase [Anaeramoeba flamelloides]
MSNSEIWDYDYELKFLIVGDSKCGKTNIFLRFTGDQFNKNMPSTLGVDVREKKEKLNNNKKVKFFVWDTYSQEHLRVNLNLYFRGAHGIILVYDVTRRETFDNLEDWINKIYMYASSDVKIMLIGNKIDLEEKQYVTKEEGLEFARNHKMMFIQTSANTKEGIRQAFHKLARKIIPSLSTSSLRTVENYSINLTETDEEGKNYNRGAGYFLYGTVDKIVEVVLALRQGLNLILNFFFQM